MVNRSGTSSLGCLTRLLLLAAVVYAGSQIGEPYYRYYRYRDAISQRVRFAGVRSDSAIVHDIYAAADTIGMPEAAYHLTVAHDRNAIRISGTYDDAWSVLNYSRDVPFTVRLQSSM